MSQRDTSISILKGIGIILVVLGHASVTQPQSYLYVRTIIYTFHMPLFLIASGFFFRAEYLNDCRTFIKKKIRGLYFPFLKWSLIFLLLHNVFYFCGILNNEFGYQGIGTAAYSTKQIALYAIDIAIRMEHYEGFHLGAYWFMRALFVGSIFLCVCSMLLNMKLQNATVSIAIIASVFWGIALIKSYFGINIPLWPQGGFRDILSVTFVGAGYLIARARDRGLLMDNRILILSTLSLISCIVIYPGKMVAGANEFDCISLVFSGLAGFIIIYHVSQWLNKSDNYLTKGLIHIGNKTFYILTFHFIMFKPVSYLKTILYDLNCKMIGCHPVIDEYNNWFWITLYAFFSITTSLLLGTACERIKYLRIK